MKTDIADLRLLLGRDVVDHLAAHVVGTDEGHRAETKSRIEGNDIAVFESKVLSICERGADLLLFPNLSD